MILVDSSVLVDWLKGRPNPKSDFFDRTVTLDSPFAISILTYQEILQGSKSEHEHKKLQDYLGTQKILYLPNQISFYDDASMLYSIIRSKGETIRSTMDILIAQTALYYELPILHNDKDFDVIARYSGLGIV